MLHFLPFIINWSAMSFCIVFLYLKSFTPSQVVLTSHKTLLFRHLDCLGLMVNFAKRIVTQPTSFVPGYSYRLSADDSNCLSRASHGNSVPRGHFQRRYRPSAQSFPENSGPYGSSFASTSVGSASHAIHSFLAEAEGSVRRPGVMESTA